MLSFVALDPFLDLVGVSLAPATPRSKDSLGQDLNLPSQIPYNIQCQLLPSVEEQ